MDLEDENTVIRPETAERTGSLPRVHMVDDVREEVDVAVREVQRLVQEYSEPKDVAVLYPASRYGEVHRVDLLEEKMMERDIDVFRLADPHRRDAKEEFIHADSPVILSSIHSSKGLEFPHVVMCGVWTDRGDADVNRRLVYVGMTRAMESLVVISTEGHPLASDLRSAVKEMDSAVESGGQVGSDVDFDRMEDAPSRAGEHWTEKEDDYLMKLFDYGLSWDEIAERHRRTEGAIKARLIKLGRIDSWGRPVE